MHELTSPDSDRPSGLTVPLSGAGDVQTTSPANDSPDEGTTESANSEATSAASSADPNALSEPADPAGSDAETKAPHDDLLIGLVGAVGTDLPWVERTLEPHLESLGYAVHQISLSALIDREFGGSLAPRDSLRYDEYVTTRMSAGNALRQHWQRADAIALLAVEEISRTRDAYGDDPPACAFILRSVKRPEEVEQLKDIVYRGQFVLIGCHTPRELRIRNLANQIARSRSSGRQEPHRAQAEALADRDERELGHLTAPPARRQLLKKYGQSLEATFPLADCYINLQEVTIAEDALKRFCDLLLGSPYISPTRDEVAMFHAQAAGIRSVDMSRQVGAAIATESGDLVAIGCNEVPRAGGGAYWEGDPNDARDFRRGYDGNQDQRDRALQEIFDVLMARDLLSPGAIDAGPAAFRDSLDDTRVDGLIEFTRSTHAEMAALLDAARRGTAVNGCTLYTSTFPCHNCAKHIVAAGIARVVFIEPYPKSLAGELHGDAIAVDDACSCPGPVTFQHFTGVAPHNCFPLFQPRGKRKSKDGSALRFSRSTIYPKLKDSFRADIFPFEAAAIEALAKLRNEFEPPTPDLLEPESGDANDATT
jgi:deoxycytidylate deaminase